MGQSDILARPTNIALLLGGLICILELFPLGVERSYDSLCAAMKR